MKWVSTKDKPPTHHHDVLVIDGLGTKFSAYYNESWYDARDSYGVSAITHWIEFKNIDPPEES